MTNGQHRGEPAHTARLLVAGDRGVLAMDESMSTCNRRFAAVGSARCSTVPTATVPPGAAATTRPPTSPRPNHGMPVEGPALSDPIDQTCINPRTWALVSDGNLMEGVASEAASPAGYLQLGKLLCVPDDDAVTLAASRPE